MISNSDIPTVRLAQQALNFYTERVARDQAMVLVTVLSTVGSTYSKAGHLLLIDDAGDFQGILSGGCLEGDLAMRSAKVIQTMAAEIVETPECLIIQLRDEIERGLSRSSKPIPKKMRDWRSRTVAAALQEFLESKKSTLPRRLREDFEPYWSPFVQQIRVVRNDAGHPASIDPVTPESVHASLLIFPEFAKLQNELLDWAEKKLASTI